MGFSDFLPLVIVCEATSVPPSELKVRVKVVLDAGGSLLPGGSEQAPKNKKRKREIKKQEKRDKENNFLDKK
ncbi:hypothetical protein P0082_00160 [Candidatus Haliotispira prima]|uniref:Uncharacterized protein n=1 Tax=Candidatus Haliotispira prima TaxID=3034016 RepID=A0ABY8MH54_9SPIO|nr:hypothetical protein P0082_00160 [Candidatus Haliotispira prima]